MLSTKSTTYNMNEARSNLSYPLIEVASPYRFHLYTLASQLADRNALKLLHTALPSRYVPEVRPGLVRSRPWLAGVRRFVGRSIPHADYPLNKAVLVDFDRWLGKGLRNAPVLLALSSSATSTMKAAKARGTRVVCDRGAWHIVEQEQVLAREADRLGLPRPHFDPWGIEREISDYETADKIFVPSTRAKLSFLAHGVAEDRIRVIPFGAHLSEDRTEHKPSRDPLRVISIGPVSLVKGHQYLVPAYRRARRKGSSLALVGEVDRELSRRLGMDEDDIDLIGTVRRDEIGHQLAMSGIFALASVTEGLALVILEAMASSLPVVATDSTGACDVIENGVEGFIVPTGDEHSFSEALCILMDNPELARAMGEAGLRKVKSLGGWTSYGDRAFAEFTSLQ